MKWDECLICGAPLEYFEETRTMTCAICGKVEHGHSCCEKEGHYVCDECHAKGMAAMFSVCLGSDSTNPYEIMLKLMELPNCHMHGPEHHILVGASLLTAYYNAGGKIGPKGKSLGEALREIQTRGSKLPGSICGHWGVCGAAISAGMYMAIVTGSNPMKSTEWGLANSVTGQIQTALGDQGGPRCCKRSSFEALRKAVAFTREHLEVDLELGYMPCPYSANNNHCQKIVCRFNPKNQ